jgi:hypothetical protein
VLEGEGGLKPRLALEEDALPDICNPAPRPTPRLNRRLWTRTGSSSASAAADALLVLLRVGIGPDPREARAGGMGRCRPFWTDSGKRTRIETGDDAIMGELGAMATWGGL